MYNPTCENLKNIELYLWHCNIGPSFVQVLRLCLFYVVMLGNSMSVQFHNFIFDAQNRGNGPLENSLPMETVSSFPWPRLRARYYQTLAIPARLPIFTLCAKNLSSVATAHTFESREPDSNGKHKRCMFQGLRIFSKRISFHKNVFTLRNPSF